VNPSGSLPGCPPIRARICARPSPKGINTDSRSVGPFHHRRNGKLSIVYSHSKGFLYLTYRAANSTLNRLANLIPAWRNFNGDPDYESGVENLNVSFGAVSIGQYRSVPSSIGDRTPMSLIYQPQENSEASKLPEILT
jgi:hypothetical protein